MFARRVTSPDGRLMQLYFDSTVMLLPSDTEFAASLGSLPGGGWELDYISVAGTRGGAALSESDLAIFGLVFDNAETIPPNDSELMPVNVALLYFGVGTVFFQPSRPFQVLEGQRIMAIVAINEDSDPPIHYHGCVSLRRNNP